MEVTCAQSIPVGGGCDFSQSPETKLYSILRITLVRIQEEFQWIIYSQTYISSSAECDFIHDFCFCLFLFCLQCRKRKLKVSVVAVPKTIDNDILFMDKTFGFDTAVEEAQRAINSAYIEVGFYCSVVCFKMHSQMNMDSTYCLNLLYLSSSLCL